MKQKAFVLSASQITFYLFSSKLLCPNQDIFFIKSQRRKIYMVCIITISFSWKCYGLKSLFRVPFNYVICFLSEKIVPLWGKIINHQVENIYLVELEYRFGFYFLQWCFTSNKCESRGTNLNKQMMNVIHGCFYEY